MLDKRGYKKENPQDFTWGQALLALGAWQRIRYSLVLQDFAGYFDEYLLGRHSGARAGRVASRTA